MNKPPRLPLRIHLIAWSSAILSGIVLGTSFPTSGHGILAWVALVPLLHALVYPGATAFRRFQLGWVAGVTFSGIVLLRSEAISETFHDLLGQDIGQALSLWLSVSLECSFVALPLAFFALLSGVVFRIPCLLTSVLLTACLWTGVEFMTSWIAPSLAWVAIAHSVPPTNPLAQNVDLLGVYGLGFLIVLSNLAIHVHFAHPRSPVRWIPLLIVLTVTGVLFQRGSGILYDDPDELTSDRESNAALGVTVLRFDPENVDDGIALTIASLKSSVRDPRPRMVVWPAPGLDDEPVTTRSLVPELEDVAVNRPLYLVSANDPRMLQILTLPTGNATHRIDLAMPPEVTTLSGGLAPFNVGALGEGDLRTSRQARRLAAKGATVLVATLNEQQPANEAHHALAVIASAYRAMENRKWVVRCSAGGVSACVDPRGQIETLLAPGVYGDLKQSIDLYDGKTPFALGGWLFAPACLLASVLGIFVVLRKNPTAQAN
jgi:apolipoprotein N-acyltransferase